ncbi:MAG: glycosyltransferase family 39 protein, partial [Clostridia bacterium]|nr:glycosyltransferase family 39 protein [Clostridia bacterium]
MKNKRLWIAVIAGGVLLAALAFFLLTPKHPAAEYGKELLVNGSFADGLNGWTTGAYVSTPGFTEYALREGEGADGSNALYIRNNELNDARFYQEITVVPDTLYLFTATVRAKAEGGRGANISVGDVYAFSDSAYDTDGAWQTVSLLGRTGTDQTSLEVYLRLGGYGGESLGEAWFDSASVTAVAEAPAGMTVESLAKAQPVSTGEVKTGTAAGIIILSSLAFLLLCAFAAISLKKDRPAPKRSMTLLALFGILLAAFSLRLILALTVTGYDVDVTDFRLWADAMYREGPVRFYQSVGFCDYPPGYLYILWLLGFIGHFFGGTSVLLVKLPSILADLGICAVLYRMAGERKTQGLLLSLLYAFSPLAICAGAAWGQGDSVMTLLLLLVVYAGMREKWQLALPLYGLAVLVKPQSLMFGPLGLAAAILSLVKAQKSGEGQKTLREFVTGLLAMCGLMAALVLPFCIGQGGVTWLFDLYGNTMGSYSHATVNACNLYFLFGLNWAGTADKAPLLVSLCACCLLTLPLIISVFLHDRKEKWPVFAVCLGLLLLVGILCLLPSAFTIGHLGYILIAFSVAEVLYLYFRADAPSHLPLCGAALLCLMFASGTMMHERYLFPASVLLLAAWLKEKDRRILWLFALVTVSCFINTACVLDRNIRIGGASGHLTAPLFGIQSDLAPLEMIAAALNVLCAPFALYLCADRCRADAPEYKAAEAPLEQATAEPWNEPLFTERQGGKMDGKDWLILSAVTVLFAVFSLTNLGATKAPQTFFVLPKQEAVVLDLGEETDFSLLYYPGIHYPESSTILLEASSDGETYAPLSEESITPGDCFRWIYAAASKQSPAHGRYVRVTAQSTGITLFEFLARKTDGTPIRITAPIGMEALADEMNSLDGEPGWFNSMYFDEIYHGRTAYELLHGLTIYEWTHPPLGKVLMSACVAIFGMTPFGWRVAGAMMGVFMIPGLYLLARLLFKKRLSALAAVALLCFDCMHFTQTRIATIDSFVVCFIIWAYYFMLKWFYLDYWKTPFWKTLVPLFFSGLFMGLSIASKWTGCYAAVGLAVLFFWGFTVR